MPVIQLLERNEIDIERWDRCVRESTHSDIYALSGWLDIMAKRWFGMVQDNYAAVLPVPWNRKYFLSYIYTPRFTSPLPLCCDPSTVRPLEDFLSLIPNRFVSWDLDILTPEKQSVFSRGPGIHGPIAETNPRLVMSRRTNHLLHLDPDYETLFSAFRPGYRNLIRQVQRKGFRAQPTGSYAEIIDKASRKKEIKGMKPEDYARFHRLCEWLAPKGMLETWETVGPHGSPCAGAVFAKNDRKLYYLLAWNNAYGRANAASHILMNEVIRAQAGNPRALDFEGSDHPGIAHFMKGFGAEPHAYLHLIKRWL